jgi:hypothetical protein
LRLSSKDFVTFAIEQFRIMVEDSRIFSSEVTFKDFLVVLARLVHKALAAEDNQAILRKWVIWATS